METKHRHSASEYMFDNPLWISIAPKHYSILVNPQAVQFCTKSSPFKSGCVLVDQSSRGMVKLVSMPQNSVYCLKLWRFKLLSGYDSVALVSENRKISEKIPPSCCLSLTSSRESYSIVFSSAEICQLWKESALKLRKNVKAITTKRADRNDKILDTTVSQDKMGCIYDISCDISSSKHWAEITVTFVDSYTSTSEHFVYDLRKHNVKSSLKEATATFKGNIDSMSFDVLHAFVSDLIILKPNEEIFEVPPFYDIKIENLRAINKDIAYNNKSRKVIEAAYRELMKVNCKQAVIDTFSLLQAQKMAIVYSSFKICRKITNEPSSVRVRRSLEADFDAEAKKCQDQMFFVAPELQIPDERDSSCNLVKAARIFKSKSMIHERLKQNDPMRNSDPKCNIF